MISDEPVNLSAVALEDMQVCFIPKSEVMGYFDKNNQFSNVMKSICGDLKEADDHMVNLAQKTVKERLAETLLYLNNTFGKKDNSLKIQLSRDELASILAPLKVVFVCYPILKKLGLIELTKNYFKDINALKN
jgi:CRP-like cAMP-binding protein